MLEGNKSISKEDFKSKLKFFQEEKKEDNDQKNKIIQVSSRTNFESVLKMYSENAKNSSPIAPNIYDSKKSNIYENKKSNNDIINPDNESNNNNNNNINLNNENLEKINVPKIIKNLNDKIYGEEDNKEHKEINEVIINDNINFEKEKQDNLKGRANNIITENNLENNKEKDNEELKKEKKKENLIQNNDIIKLNDETKKEDPIENENKEKINEINKENKEEKKDINEEKIIENNEIKNDNYEKLNSILNNEKKENINIDNVKENNNDKINEENIKENLTENNETNKDNLMENNIENDKINGVNLNINNNIDKNYSNENIDNIDKLMENNNKKESIKESNNEIKNLNENINSDNEINKENINENNKDNEKNKENLNENNKDNEKNKENLNENFNDYNEINKEFLNEKNINNDNDISKENKNENINDNEIIKENINDNNNDNEINKENKNENINDDNDNEINKENLNENINSDNKINKENINEKNNNNDNEINKENLNENINRDNKINKENINENNNEHEINKENSNENNNNDDKNTYKENINVNNNYYENEINKENLNEKNNNNEINKENISEKINNDINTKILNENNEIILKSNEEKVKNKETLKNQNSNIEIKTDNIINNNNISRKTIEKNVENEIKEEINTDKKSKKEDLYISKEKIEVWKKILCKNFNIKTFNTSLTQKKVEDNKKIKEEVAKTREKEELQYPLFHKNLEIMIHNYLYYNEIKYKSGLNEVISIFILLKYKLNISILEILNLTQGFILKFLTNYFQEEETIFALKSSLGLLILLLRYHSPKIYNILDKANIFPEMFASNWILTLFSSKLELDICYYFWDKLIIENDEIFIYFFLVALLIVNGEKILSGKENYLSKILSRITIKSFEEVDFIFNYALDLRNETPYSFRLLSKKLEIYQFNSKNLESLYDKYKPNSLIAMPIFPTEIFYICYNNIFKCPDEYCKNCYGIEKGNLKRNKNNNDSFDNYFCPHCETKSNKKLKYMILDLRILNDIENEKEKKPFLPQMIMIEQEELKLPTFSEKITERFLKDKGFYHFIFMISEYNYYENYEDSFYYIDTLSSRKMDSSRDKKISLKETNKNLENENMKNLLVSLLNYNYPYISFCYGGFLYIHELSYKYNINLLNHNQKCYLCKNMNKNKLNSFIKSFGSLKFWKKSESSKYNINVINTISLNEVSQLIKEKNFDVSYGFLIEINGEKVVYENEIMVLIKENEIQLLKYSKSSFDLEIINNINLLDINSIDKYQQSKICLKIKNKEAKKNDNKIKIDLKNENNSKKLISIITQRKNNIQKEKYKKK